MSTFLNTTTNVTAPYESCSFLGPISPPSNNTLVSCSIPDCRNNRATIEQCCTGGTITTFNQTQRVPQRNITINAEYLTCTFDVDISGYNDLTTYAPNETVFALPDCIVRNGGSRLLCNRPNSELKSCPGPYTGQPGYGTGTGATTCTVNNQNENLTSLITTCCQSSEGTIRAEQEGCAISCSGDENLTSCLRDGYSGSLQPGGGFGYGCGNRSETGGAQTLGGLGKTTMASVMLATVAVLAMLH